MSMLNYTGIVENAVLCTVALISPLFDLARQIITIDTNDGKWGWLHFPNDTNAIKKMPYFHTPRILKKS